MKPRLRDVPGAVLCLAAAVARGERREALQLAQFVRGLAIQITLRFVCREMLVRPGRAVLLFSRLDGPRVGVLRSVAGVVMAAFVGVLLFLVSNALLFAPLSIALAAFGVGSDEILDAGLGLAVVRLGWTATRAVRTYALDRRRSRGLIRVGDSPRWRLDLMGATPPGAGHGSALLKELVTRSDAAGATVYLVTEPHNRAFYRRGGFHVLATDDPAFDGMLLMRRVAPHRTITLPAQRPARQPASR